MAAHTFASALTVFRGSTVAIFHDGYVLFMPAIVLMLSILAIMTVRLSAGSW